MSSNKTYTIVGINYWPEPSGNAPYTTDLAEELAKTSKVTVVTGIPHYPWWEKQKQHTDDQYIIEHPHLKIKRRNHFVPKSQSNVLRAFMEVSFGLSAVFSGELKGSVAILLSPGMLSSAIVLAWIRLTQPKTKVLVWVQDLYEQGLQETGQNSGFLTRSITSIENWMLRSTDEVVVAHPAFLEAKKASLSPQEKSRAIPNWSQFSFTPMESRETTRDRYAFEGSTIVLHIGNLGIKQGLENVVNAAKISDDTQSKVKFVLVGGGNQVEKLKAMAAGIRNIQFVPTVSEKELANLLQAADILLVNEKPGVQEMSIPSKLTTYFQSQVPVLVCSEANSLAGRIVIENGLGFWAQSGNPEGLLKRIETLELESRVVIARKAKLFADEFLSKEAALLQFRETLENL
jgi:glycosyltransferase involved in cell wall biosynthesis